MGEEVPADGLTVWETCSLAYTMLAEHANRQDDLLRLAAMLTGNQPQGISHREELDDWLETVPEEE